MAFAREGLGRAGHAQVAQCAGVSVPTVFKYFPSRAALVSAVLNQVERRFLTLARRAHQAGRSPQEAMREHARGFVQVAQREPELARIWLEWSGSLRADVWPRFLRLEEKLTRIIAASIEPRRTVPGRLTAMEAALALNGVAHVLIHMIIAPKHLPGDPEAFALHTVDALLRLTSAAEAAAGNGGAAPTITRVPRSDGARHRAASSARRGSHRSKPKQRPGTKRPI